MNRNGLAEHVADTLSLSKTEASRVIDVVLTEIVGALARGDDVRLVGFGTFTVQARAATVGRNPVSGAAIAIAAAKTVRFRCGSALKVLVNEHA